MVMNPVNLEVEIMFIVNVIQMLARRSTKGRYNDMTWKQAPMGKEGGYGRQDRRNAPMTGVHCITSLIPGPEIPRPAVDNKRGQNHITLP